VKSSRLLSLQLSVHCVEHFRHNKFRGFDFIVGVPFEVSFSDLYIGNITLQVRALC
jgi:hypothetical protein